MGLMAGLLFFAIKLALIVRGPRLGFCQQIGFLACWPGMDLNPFVHRGPGRWPSVRAFLPPLACIVVGLLALKIAALSDSPLVGGWFGMVSLILCFHFGAFHLLALALQAIGFAVKPIMGHPLSVASLGQFWGGTWNRAFTDAVHPLLVRPLAKHFGIKTALMVAFLASGVAHELVISVPANGGYGGPFLYFVIQGLGVMLERRLRLTKYQLTHGLRGRLFALGLVLIPAPILFHPPFLERVIHPFVHFLTKPGLLL